MTTAARAFIRRASRTPVRQFVADYEDLAAVPAGIPRREKVARELVLSERRTRAEVRS